MVDLKQTAELQLIANMVAEQLKHEDRAALFATREHNVVLISLLYDMEPEERIAYFKEQAFPTYQEADLIINYKLRKIKQIEGWQLGAMAMGRMQDALYHEQQILVWEAALSLWIDVRRAATNIFDVMWRLGIAASFPGDQHRRESGILGMFGGAARAMAGRLSGIKKSTPKGAADSSTQRTSALETADGESET